MAEEKSTFGSAAYGGAGWSGRTRGLAEEIGDLWTDCGIDSEWALDWGRRLFVWAKLAPELAPHAS